MPGALSGPVLAWLHPREPPPPPRQGAALFPAAAWSRAGCRAEWSWLAVFQNKVLDVDGMKVKLQVRGGGCGVGR